MGLSIHYWGTINSHALVPDLVSELLEIGRVLKWDVTEIGDEEPGNPPRVQGVIVNYRNGSEPMPFLLDREGSLRSMVFLMGHEDEFTKTVSVKTQYGPVSDHMNLVNLLRYLKKAYFHDLKVEDEGGVWEGGSEEKLVEKKTFLDEAIQAVTVGLSQLSRIEGDITESILPVIEAIHQRMLKEGKIKPDVEEGA